MPQQKPAAAAPVIRTAFFWSNQMCRTWQSVQRNDDDAIEIAERWLGKRIVFRRGSNNLQKAMAAFEAAALTVTTRDAQLRDGPAGTERSGRRSENRAREETGR